VKEREKDKQKLESPKKKIKKDPRLFNNAKF
jgi:hypothetical protein